MDSLPQRTREENDRLLARARAARDRARELIAESTMTARLTAGRLDEAELLVAISQQMLHEMRTSVSAYAALLRETATPPERAIIDVKAMVREAMAETGPRSEALTALVVHWAVDAYYAA